MFSLSFPGFHQLFTFAIIFVVTAGTTAPQVHPQSTPVENNQVDMQLTAFITVAFAALALAAPEASKKKGPRVSRPPVCGGDTEAACCQTDVPVGVGINWK